jgi:pyruvate/2-oxoglutarate dehydrogenase complex dihydrolipoamide acyltransferase (E2) component
MPLFRRPDGVLCRDVLPVRRIVPYLMRRRNESAVYHEKVYDLTRARPWLRAYNRSHQDRATLFHLFLYACARALHARPGLNRFVSGGRIYQRNEVAISFAAKKEMKDEAPFVTVKVEIPSQEPFEATVRRIADLVGEGRRGPERQVDKEVGIVTSLPGVVVSLLLGLARLLDRFNLFPGFMIRPDPMYASLFLANLGSVGISDTWHHLYEYGTVSIFGVIGQVERLPFVEGDGVAIRDGVRVRFTFDERINDGFYSAASLGIAQRVLEDPARHLGPPEAPLHPVSGAAS